MRWWPVIGSNLGWRPMVRSTSDDPGGSSVDGPTREARFNAAPDEPQASFPDARFASVLQVLVVDDSPLNLLGAIDLLAHFGITPVIACNGAEALELTRGQRFDLILMDISMPIMDGLETALYIRQRELEHPQRPRTTIVAYTSGKMLADKAMQARAGFDGALEKPCGVPEMQAFLLRLHPTSPVLHWPVQLGAPAQSRT
jgi:CheY-like chemotaxis protein